jgi:3-isopropylmalate/(R)-2-methylmalate dehydratase small subunit
MGLPILECPDTDRFNTASRLSVDFDTGEIVLIDDNSTYATHPIPPFMQELVQSGGLMKYIEKRIK